MKTQRRYGWKPQRPDHRDFSFRRVLDHDVPVPDTFPIPENMQPPYDQGQLGSCTGNAIAGALEYDRIFDQLPPFTPARLFIYYFERSDEGTIDSDSGAEIRDGIKVVASIGAPSEVTWPYDVSQFAVAPSTAAIAEARLHPAVLYGAVPQGKLSIQQCIAAGFPVIFGFSVPASFEGNTVAETGVLLMPSPGEEIIGGHAVCAVGYDQVGVWVRNSWGVEWGMKGYFHMPWEMLLSPDWCSDFWVIRSTE